MKIEKNKFVTLVYELRENDNKGELVEILDPGSPLKFVFGSGRLITGFESNISMLRKGDDFRFTLLSEDAYGERREDMIINVPSSVFERDGKLDDNLCQVGKEVPMMDSEGHPLTGIICEISGESVKMDFNHPMAGVDLYFEGRILDVREATEEELSGLSSTCSSCHSHSESGCSSGMCNI
jgi:FKBP-type peptidyl-prolyl cis-trans isomerase SlyD